MGTRTIKIKAQPPTFVNLPNSVQKLSGALLTTVSAVTAMGLPLALGSAFSA